MMRVAPIETAVEIAAVAWFGACSGIGLWLIAPSMSTGALLLALSGAAMGCLGALAAMRGWRNLAYALPSFEVYPLTFEAVEELLLTDEVAPARVAPVGELVLTLAQRLGATQDKSITAPQDELLLEDVLTRIDPESRVIRLFDPAAMPTAGELQSRIDRHLQNREAPTYPDAAQALNDALADLRRSLR